MNRRQRLGLIALSLLASAGWFVDDFLPVEGSPLAGEGFRLLVCAVLTSGVPALRRPRAARISPLLYLRAAIVSLGAITLPFVLLNAARGLVSSTEGVLIFTLMPVAAMLIVNSLGGEQTDLAALPSVVLGAAGVMILLPVRLPAGRDCLLGTLLLVAAMLLTATSMVLVHRLLQRVSLDVAVPAVAMGNGLMLIATAGVGGWGHFAAAMLLPHGLRAVLFDLPQFVIFMWLLKAISPQRLSGRFLITPLLTVVEGLFLVRPHFDLRTLAGLTLLALGAGFALFGRETTEQDGSRVSILPRASGAGHPRSGGDGRS